MHNLILEKTDQVRWYTDMEGASFEIACPDSSGTILVNPPSQAIRSF